jgi:hypothetical protein
MGYLTFTEITPEGVTTKDISEISIGDEVETLMALDARAFTLACVVCLAPVQSGLGHSYCPTHTPNKYKK